MKIKMKPHEKQLLINTLHIQSYSGNTDRMEDYIINYINSLGLTHVYDNGNIYITKGVSDNYPCMISHTDTVHEIIPDKEYTIIANDEFAIGYNKIKMQATGCGGDDKVGIFMCLQLLQEYDAIKIAFFRDEEVGCVGSYDANIDFFSDTRFVLQCDRRGNTDFVDNIYSVQLQSKRFKRDVSKILSKYGYTPTHGMLTDVYAIKQMGVGVSVANMSCGYYNPHCDDETISLVDVSNCLNMCRDIFTNMTSVYEHKTDTVGKTNKYIGGYGSYNDWENWSDDWDMGKSKTIINPTNTQNEIDFYENNEKCGSCLEWKNHEVIEYCIPYNCFVCDDCMEEVGEPAIIESYDKD